MGKEKEQFPEYMETTYKKSNILINARGKATLMAFRLFAAAIGQAHKSTEDNTVVATIPVKTLSNIIGTKSNSLYETVFEATVKDNSGKRRSLLDWRIIIKDDESEAFRAVNVLQDAEYKNGTLKLRFNNSLTDELIGLKSNFTILNLQEAVKLNSVYSSQLYEMLKSNMDYQRAIHKTPAKKIEWQINLVELYLRLGIIDPECDPEVAAESKKESPNYDKILKIAKEKKAMKYGTFGQFKKWVLTRAIDEVNENTSISVSYDTFRSGKGGKVTAVIFTINDKIEEEKEMIIEDEIQTAPEINEMDFILKMSRIIKEDISFNGFKAIAEAAGYDMGKIEKAYQVAESSPQISNLVGFMLTAIKNGYEPAVKKSSVKRMEGWDFPERTYDYDELERKLRKN